MKYIFSLVFLVLIPPVLSAQAPAIEWEKCYGGTRDDRASCIIQTTDGGYAIAGSAASDDFDIRHGENNYTGKHDFWIVKINSKDSIEWQVMFGGTDEDNAYSIIQTYDGGYLVTGETVSKDGDVSGYHGIFLSPRSDYWVVKLNNKGVLEWQKPLGGTNDETSARAVQTKDSNYVISGWTWSKDGDVTGNDSTLWKNWSVKMDRSGSILWEKCAPTVKKSGITGTSEHMAITATSDGGFAVAGLIDTSGVSLDHQDGMVFKFDDTGVVQWFKVLGGLGNDFFNSIIQTMDGGYAMAGTTTSNKEEMANHGTWDFWVVKLRNDGSFEWEKCFGGSNEEVANSIIQTKEGGYAVAGYTTSGDGDVIGFHAAADFWLVKLSSAGILEWQKSLGGSDYETAHSVIQSKDGGFVLAGETLSRDGDVTGIHPPFGASDADYWIVKLQPVLSVPETPKPAYENIFLSPNPGNGIGKISYNIAAFSFVKIEIFNLLGVNLRTLINSKEEEGSHEHTFDISDLPSGTYFLRVELEGKSVMKPVELIH